MRTKHIQMRVLCYAGVSLHFCSGKTAQGIHWLTVLFYGRVETLDICKASWQWIITRQNTAATALLQYVQLKNYSVAEGEKSIWMCPLMQSLKYDEYII